MSILLATFKKQLILEMSYKLNFFLQFISMPISIMSFYFLSKMIGSSGSLIDYGGYYFPFVILGVASLDFCVSIINSINNSIRDDQISGVLEEIYIIDNNYYKYVLSLSVYPLIFNIIKFNVYIFFALFFGLQISFINFLNIYPIFILTFFALVGLSLITISFILIFKKGNFLNSFLISVFGLFSGIIYPISVLPDFISKASMFLPPYNLAEIIRVNLLSINQSTYNLYLNQLTVSILLILLGLFSIRYAIHYILLKKSLNEF